jgi:hypothetical protein
MFETTLNRLNKLLAGFFKPLFQSSGYLAVAHLDKFIFLFIPVTYLLISTVIHNSLGPFFMGRVDPEYFYMYNGIVLGAGNLSIQYYFHPGTPLHFLIAFSARIIDLFQPGDYMKNFVDDPEKYIHAANLLINSIISILLFVCGRYTKRYTSSYPAGFAMQMVPFASVALLSLQGRVFADTLLIIPLILLLMLIIRHIFKEDSQKTYPDETVLFGMVTGLGIACKLTFLPVILLPLILLKSAFTGKIKLILYTLFFFALFAYPVIFNFGDFGQWASGKFLNSGQSGDGQVVYSNASSVFVNFKQLMSANKELIGIVVFSLILNIIFSFRYFRERSLPGTKLRRAIYAVNITIIVCILFTLKHFKPYYFAPFSVFKYLLALLSVMLLFSYRKIAASRLYKSLTITLFSALVILSVSIQAIELRSVLRDNYARISIIQKEYGQLTSLVKNDRPIILTGPYYGMPFIEFAHFAGFSMTDNMKGFYTAYLKEKYPNSYQYVTWSDKFDFWDDFVEFPHILEKAGSSFYIYIGKENSNDLLEIENRMWKYLDKNSVTMNVLYEDKNSDEKLIEVSNIQHSTLNIQH